MMSKRSPKITPAEFPHRGPHHAFPLRKAFAEYAAFICEQACTIALLPGYEKSAGASVELALAKICGLDVLHIPGVPVEPKTEARP